MHTSLTHTRDIYDARTGGSNPVNPYGFHFSGKEHAELFTEEGHLLGNFHMDVIAPAHKYK